MSFEMRYRSDISTLSACFTTGRSCGRGFKRFARRGQRRDSHGATAGIAHPVSFPMVDGAARSAQQGSPQAPSKCQCQWPPLLIRGSSLSKSLCREPAQRQPSLMSAPRWSSIFAAGHWAGASLNTETTLPLLVRDVVGRTQALTPTEKTARRTVWPEPPLQQRLPRKQRLWPAWELARRPDSRHAVTIVGRRDKTSDLRTTCACSSTAHVV